jgi:hypothetical protein
VFTNADVHMYMFFKIFNSITGTPQYPAHAGLSLRRMMCVLYIKGAGGVIPASPTAVWSFGTAPLRSNEINIITAWGFAGNINGHVAGGVIGAPTARNQAPFVITILPNTLWIPPPLQPIGLGNLQIDLFDVLLQLRGLN